ncbi:MAG: hypothetical protein DYG96_08150 [Chlorobi bacterium CHB2]|nr:hypothetical protein [Chlorobi bacterium CHB2]
MGIFQDKLNPGIILAGVNRDNNRANPPGRKILDDGLGVIMPKCGNRIPTPYPFPQQCGGDAGNGILELEIGVSLLNNAIFGKGEIELIRLCDCLLRQHFADRGETDVAWG